jgi:hypothetical protein
VQRRASETGGYANHSQLVASTLGCRTGRAGAESSSLSAHWFQVHC